MMNDHPLALIPAFVLGALDPEAASAIAQHVATCASCRAEVDAFRKSIVSDSIEPHTWPRSHVKHRLMERISADIHRPMQLHLQKRIPRRRSISVALAGAAMMGAILMVIIWLRIEQPTHATALSNDQMLREHEIALIQRRVPGDDRLVDLLTTPGTIAHDLFPGSPAPTAYAVLYVHSGDPRVGVLIRDLPPAPAGYTYQLWVANEGDQVSLGVFTTRDDGITELIALAPAQIDTYTDFMVTVEPHGGAATPSSVVVWQVKL